MSLLYRIPALTLILILSSCGFGGNFKLPGVYRADIQQGNAIDQEMIDRLRPGMDKDQVYFILGTPAIVDPFHTDQWEYIYSMSERGGPRYQRHLRIYFEENKLSYVDGDVVTSLRQPPEVVRQSRTVDVPDDIGRKGIIRKMLNAIPFVGDDGTKEPGTADDTEPAPPEPVSGTPL